VGASPTRTVAATAGYCSDWPQPVFQGSAPVTVSGPGWPRGARALELSASQPGLWQADVTKVVFDVPAPGVRADQVLVVIHTRVTGTDVGWRQPYARFELAAWLPTGPGTSRWVTVCPEANPGLDAAMRAGGYPPLPAPARPGATVTGWVAFPMPRDATALALRTTGGTTEVVTPIMLRQAGDPR
jgi:hypothetical protein